MMRSSVVLPEPDGPSSATNRPRGISRSTASRAAKCPNFFVIWRTVMLMRPSPSTLYARATRRRLLSTNVASASSASSDATANAGTKQVIVIENFDLQRHGIRQPADVTRDDRHRAELAHGARVAEDDAVEQSPLDVGQRDAQKRLPAARAERQRGLFFVVALRRHQRQQLARDERKRDEDRRQHDARHGEDDLDVVGRQPRSEQSLGAEEQHVRQPGHDRRDRERQIDQRDQQALAGELELADGPRRGRRRRPGSPAPRSPRGEQRQADRRRACRDW